MPRIGLITCLLLAVPAVPQSPIGPTPTPPAHLRVVVHGGAGLVDRLIRAGFDAVPHPPLGHRRAAEVILDERDLGQLQRLTGGTPIVLERSRPFREIAAAWRRAAGPAAPPDSRYHTPTEIAAELLALQQSYPGLARRFDLNARYRLPPTHGGRVIHGLKISDNPGTDEDEPAMLLVANHHARELNTIVAALHAARQLLGGYASDPRLRQLIDGNEIWIVPTMNPDGLAYVWSNDNMWRKNRRDNGNGRFGVDQNRNYPYFWSRCGSSSDPRSDIYHGPAAGSEPETRVMLAMGRAEVFDRMLDLHSYGRDVRYGYNRLTGPRLPIGWKTYLDQIQGEVARAMSYQTNSSCCCGGDQHWHLAENGTLAYLVEMDQSFQPPWTQTQLEVQRVWAGVRHLFERAVPLRGHLRSLAGSRPLAGEFEVVGQPLRDGQRRRSSARHGRFVAWLPTGTYSLRFLAPGHDPRTVQVTVTDGKTLDLEVLLTPTMRPTVLSARGTPRVGSTAHLDLSSPDDPGRQYVIGAALGSTPGIQIGPRTVPLNDDALLASMTSMLTIFRNAFGRLDANGAATMDFVIPPVPALAGIRVHFCGVATDGAWPSSVKGISNPVVLTLQR